MLMVGTDSSVPLDRPAVGMAGERGFPPARLAMSVGLVVCAPQHRHDLRAVELDVGRIEARRGERQPQIVEASSRFSVSVRSEPRIWSRPARKLSSIGLALEPLVEGLGIEIAGAFVEQRRHQIGDAGLAGADPGRRRRRKRNSMAISGTAGSRTSQASMPPGLTTRSIVVAAPAAPRQAPAQRRAQRRRRPPRAAETVEQDRAGTKRSRAFLLGLQVFDQIAGHRPAHVEPWRAASLHRIGGHGADAVGPGADLLDGLAGRQRRAVPARQRRLVVLGIDGVGDQPVLGAIELVGGDAIAR